MKSLNVNLMIIWIYLILLGIILLYLFFRYDIHTIKQFLKVLYWNDTKQQRLDKLLEKGKTIEIYKNRDLNVFEYIEPINKKILMKNIESSIPLNTLKEDEIYNYLRSDYTPYYKNYVIATTSGTSGQMGIFINDMKDWITIQAVLFKKLIYNHIFKFIPHLLTGINTVFIVPTSGHFMSHKLPVPVLKTFFINTIIFSIFEEDLVNKVNNSNPHMIYTYPSVLERIYDQLDIFPVIIITGGEQLSLDFRRSLKTKFKDVNIIETYGSSECPFMGTSCEFGNIHINDDLCIIEPIDKKGDLITEKYIKSESILLTNLLNTFQPIIRYELDDSIEYIECFCKNASPAIKIHSRKCENVQVLDNAGNVQIHTPMMLKMIFISIPYNFTFQLIYKSQNYLDINVNTNKTEDIDMINNLINKNIGDYMKHFNIKLSYIINFNKPFYTNKSGKFSTIVIL